ncbi:MAG: glycosyltransferase family 4 protein [Thermodesulfobacteriota bacterium]
MKKGLSILHTESSRGWGGQENRTLQECIGLQKMGARVIILCQPESKLTQKAGDAGIEVRTHYMRNSIDVSAICFILGLIKEENIDVVSTHSGKDSMIGALAGRLSSRRPRIVRTRHLALPITSKVTYSILPHKIVTVSEHVRDYLVNGEGIRSDKVVVVPTGIELNRFDPDSITSVLRKDIGVGDDVPLVGTTAILRMKKGHHILLEAIKLVLKRVPRAIFLFIGDGPQTDNIKKRIKESGLNDSVLLLGLRKDIPEILGALDLFVLPTLQEALGTAILEAMAMGKSVVATRVGGVPEVVKDGINGILVDPDDPQGLADAIIKLLKDKDRGMEMGSKGRVFVEKKYSIENMVKDMYALYQGLIEVGT